MRTILAILVGLAAIAAPAAALDGMPGATPAAPGLPLFVQLASIEGLPKEPAAREQFEQAFRMVFADDSFSLAAAAARGGAEVEGARTINRFRLLEGSPGEDVWSLRLVLGTPPLVVPAKPKVKKGDAPPRRNAGTLGRATRGLTVVFMLLSPEAVKADARPIPDSYGLVFPDPKAADGVGDRVSSGGYEFPWSDAGRATGLLALELLHQRAGELPEKDHLFLGEGVRRTAVGR